MPKGPEYPKESLIHMTAHAGHQAAYHQMFASWFGLSPSEGRIGPRLFARLVKAERLFFGTLDDDVAGFATVTVARALLGRRTGGLFLHPNSCFGPGLKPRVKWIFFASLSRIPKVTILSILPYGLMPKLRSVSNGYVHDPQFYDHLEASPSADSATIRSLTDAAAGRPILAFLGWGTQEKAYPALSELAAQPGLADRILIVAAGKVVKSCAAAATRLRESGAIVLDRFVSDEEMEAIYRSSRWVWNCYAPGYEQASGIFGRAVQQGRTVVLRHDSVTLAYYAQLLDHPAVALPESSAAAAAVLIDVGSAPQAGTASNNEHVLQSLRTWKNEFREAVDKAITN